MPATRTCAPSPTACSSADDHQSGIRGRRGPPDHEPPVDDHRRIVRAIADDAKRAFYTGTVTVNWATDENYQWDLPDSSGRFYIPDVTFIHPEATTAEEERAAIALVVEVTHRRRRRIRS